MIRADVPLWAALLIVVLASAALVGRRAVYAHIDRSLAAGMGDLPRVNAAMRLVLRGGFVLIAGVLALAGVAAVVLNITGPIGD